MMPPATAEDVAPEATAADEAVLDVAEAEQLPEAILEEATKLNKSKALIVVGNHRLPSDRDDTLVIVTEERKVNMTEDGAVKSVDVKYNGYPAGADLYYRTEEAIEFPKGATIMTLGVDVQQGLTWGFSPDVAWVHVGPASPAYAAANLAWQRGATEIEIIGLDDREKAQLQAFIDRLPTDTVAPSSAKVTLA